MDKLTLRDFLNEEIAGFFIIVFTILLGMVMGWYIQGIRSIGIKIMLFMGFLILFVSIIFKAKRRFENYKKSNS
jgi:carbon starvation protein CstA